MRLATIKYKNKEQAGIVCQNGIVLIETINQAKDTDWATDMFQLIENDEIPQITQWYNAVGKSELESMDCIAYENVVYGPLYRNPLRIFGIGLNYQEHATDIGQGTPVGFPGCFYKPASTIAGPGDEILIPDLEGATKTTGEAELGVILGRRCKNIEENQWEEYVAGYTTILDMTEESILKLNPRFLTLVKGFDTFFVFGPHFVTPDEVEDVKKLEVQTVLNGEVHAKNVVANMLHSIPRQISLVSKIQGWFPGDVLSTGTPRAVHINEGDILECRIFGPDGFAFEPLKNPVVDLKLKK